MQYEMRRPSTEAEAIQIIESALGVLYGQIEFHRGDRKRAWNGDFVNHCKTEATHALAWLADHRPSTGAQCAFKPWPPEGTDLCPNCGGMGSYDDITECDVCGAAGFVRREDPYTECLDCGDPFLSVPNSGDKGRCIRCRAQY